MGDWYNPLSWSVFDVAGTAWTKEVGAAHDQAVSWIERTASGKGWDGSWTVKARDLADAARAATSTPIDYWSNLASAWRGYQANVPDGWTQLGATWTSASGAASTQQASAELNSVGAVAGGTIAKSAGDVADAAQWVRDHKTGIIMGVLVVLVLLAVVYVNAVGKK